MKEILDRPKYNPDEVQPLRDELTAVGFRELLTPDEVDKAATEGDNLSLFVVNSVCGCAAGAARPGVTRALQHDTIPDNLLTIFAGMEQSALARLRQRLEPNLPSSPCIALFRGEILIHMLHRHDIEGHSAAEVAGALTELFDRHCSAPGSSIPPAEYEKIVSPEVCGSTLQTFDG